MKMIQSDITASASWSFFFLKTIFSQCWIRARKVNLERDKRIGMYYFYWGKSWHSNEVQLRLSFRSLPENSFVVIFSKTFMVLDKFWNHAFVAKGCSICSVFCSFSRIRWIVSSKVSDIQTDVNVLITWTSAVKCYLETVACVSRVTFLVNWIFITSRMWFAPPVAADACIKESSTTKIGQRL
jgi:hypothetical protein